jgi:hypothetical protein
MSSTGNSPVTVTGIVVPPGYSTNVATATIQPGSSQQITVRLTPTQPIEYAGILTVTGDQTSGNSTVSITGTGTLVRPSFPSARTRAPTQRSDIRFVYRRPMAITVWMPAAAGTSARSYFKAGKRRFDAEPQRLSR